MNTIRSMSNRCEMLRPIKTDADYEAALARVAELMDCEDDSPEGEELDLLATLIEVYDDKHFPMGMPSPAAAIRFRMEQQELSVEDLAPTIGSVAKVEEILSGKRALTLPMIRALHEQLEIPAEILIRKPRADADVMA